MSFDSTHLRLREEELEATEEFLEEVDVVLRPPANPAYADFAEGLELSVDGCSATEDMLKVGRFFG